MMIRGLFESFDQSRFKDFQLDFLLHGNFAITSARLKT